MKRKKPTDNVSQQHMRTSTGRGPNSMPNNKHKRRNWKKYRGQG